MIDQVYNLKILELAGNITRTGSMDNSDASAEAHSKLCGSKVKVWLKISDGVVSDFAHEVKACALGQAASSIMAEHVVGASLQELKDIRQQTSDMLREGGKPPEGKFSDIKYLEPIKDYRARHASTMLTFDAVVMAIEDYEKNVHAA